MTRSRSNTPPPAKRQNSNNQYHDRSEFSPLSSGRRGSVSSGGGNNGLQSHGHPPPPPPHHKKLQTRDSVDKDKQRRLELVARAKARREKMLKRVRREKKTMLFSSILAFLSLFLWFIAVFTDHWFYVYQTKEMLDRAFNVSLSLPTTPEVFIESKTGLWKTCRSLEDIRSRQRRVECSYFRIFLTSREEAKEGLNTHNEHVIDYTRAQICFAFISVLLMTMTIVAAFYTFKNSRYVYKRLAACLYFMTTISVLVVLEVLVTSVNYAEGAKLYPPQAIVVYGFSFYMGWSVFLVYLVNGCIFLILSRKRKHDKELEDDTDGGFVTGR